MIKGVFEYAIGNNIAGVTNFFSSIKIPKNAVVTKRRSLTEKEVCQLYKSLNMDSEEVIKQLKTNQ